MVQRSFPESICASRECVMRSCLMGNELTALVALSASRKLCNEELVLDRSVRSGGMETSDMVSMARQSPGGLAV
jgi:hypothetical protein